jgi:hypothetical protein
MNDYADMLDDEDTEKLVLDALAEFFQDSFDEDPAGVADWLVQGGTSPDLFIHLVVALRQRLAKPPAHRANPTTD